MPKLVTSPRSLVLAVGEPRLTAGLDRRDSLGLGRGQRPPQPAGQCGYPVVTGAAVPPWLAGTARQAVAACPALALRLAPAGHPGWR